MKQYCRYCAFCFEGDALYCGEKDMVLSESQYRSTNNCPYFALSELGDARTGKEYTPREKRVRRAKEGQQMRMEI